MTRVIRFPDGALMRQRRLATARAALACLTDDEARDLIAQASTDRGRAWGDAVVSAIRRAQMRGRE